jgi:hypothetical protein
MFNENSVNVDKSSANFFALSNEFQFNKSFRNEQIFNLCTLAAIQSALEWIKIATFFTLRRKLLSFSEIKLLELKLSRLTIVAVCSQRFLFSFPFLRRR